MEYSDFEVISDVQIEHKAETTGIKIGRVVQVRYIPDNKITKCCYWYDYSSPDVPLLYVT